MDKLTQSWQFKAFMRRPSYPDDALIDISAEAERAEPPAPKDDVSWFLTICVYCVYWFKVKDKMMRIMVSEIKVHYRLGYRHWGGVFVAVEVCLGRNDTSIMSRSLSMLASQISKTIILDWMVDFSCARTSIRGHEIPGRKCCSLTMNTWPMSQYPTLCEVDHKCVRTSMKCQ